MPAKKRKSVRRAGEGRRGARRAGVREPRGERRTANPATRAFAPPFAKCSERLRAVQQSQRHWLVAVIRARAVIAHWNNELDNLNERIAREVLHVVDGDRESPRYVRYYGKHTPHEVSRMGLETQLDETELWPEMLAKEPEAALSNLSARYAELHTQGRAALGTLSRAELGRDDQRIQEILPLVADINTLRDYTFAELLKLFGKREAKDFFA
jgi:hypothetical protein